VSGRQRAGRGRLGQRLGRRRGSGRVCPGTARRLRSGLLAERAARRVQQAERAVRRGRCLVQQAGGPVRPQPAEIHRQGIVVHAVSGEWAERVGQVGARVGQLPGRRGQLADPLTQPGIRGVGVEVRWLVGMTVDGEPERAVLHVVRLLPLMATVRSSSRQDGAAIKPLTVKVERPW
jgi:hypothetical protein